MSTVWWQYLVVAILVGWSLFRLGRQLLPHRVGASGRSGGCDSGCGSCKGCGTAPAIAVDATAPVVWRDHHRSS